MIAISKEPPQAAPWLLNTWYVAAWSRELGPELLGRTLLDKPVVMWRNEAGAVKAIGGICPHRFAPLALGKRVGDCVECPYHGLRFDDSGACSHNPHGDGRIPRAATVPAYPVQERHQLVWIWMGEAERADPDLIPALPHLDRADLGHVTCTLEVAAHYELYVDNLMDLTHAQFVHGDFMMSNRFDTAQQAIAQEGNRIANRIFIPASEVPPMFRPYFAPEVQAVDYWMDSFWSPPSIVTNYVGVTLPERSREEGFYSHGTHIVTPASRHASHYFCGNSRSRDVGVPEADARIREWQRVGFGIQDKTLIEPRRG